MLNIVSRFAWLVMCMMTLSGGCSNLFPSTPEKEKQNKTATTAPISLPSVVEAKESSPSSIPLLIKEMPSPSPSLSPGNTDTQSKIETYFTFGSFEPGLLDQARIGSLHVNKEGNLLIIYEGNIFSINSKGEQVKKVKIKTTVNPMVLGLTTDENDNMYIIDRNQILKITFSEEINLLAGTPASSSINQYRDGSLLEAKFGVVQGIAYDSQGKYFLVADTENNRIRKIDPKANEVTTFAGTGSIPQVVQHFTTPGLISDGQRKEAYLYRPTDITIHGDDIYFIEPLNDVVRQIDKSGFVSTFINFNSPSTLALDSKRNVYIAETDLQNERLNTIHKITKDKTQSYTLSVKGEWIPDIYTQTKPGTFIWIAKNTNNSLILKEVSDIAIDAQDNLYIAESGNGRILKLSL